MTRKSHLDLVFTLRRRLVVRFHDGSSNLEYFVECLKALPSLRTLEIMGRDLALDRRLALTGLCKTVFRGYDFPSITKVTIPLSLHPILHRLPNLKELACFGHFSRESVVPALDSVRRPYVKERSGEVEPVFTSFTVIDPHHDPKIAKGM